MATELSDRFDHLADWRAALDREVARFGQWLDEHDLLGDAGRAQLRALRERLAGERIVLAVVAEFSRGKSELINAMFFADGGQRLLPASPGRTTMCPVELGHEPGAAPRLRLLPIETRLQGLSIAELRGREQPWQTVPLDPSDAAATAHALEAVTRVLAVDVERARALGFWHDESPEDNPQPDADGRVAVPAWRHAIVDHPHPLLRSGLVVVDTPGLNAIGAEPELTLALLPSAHAVLFVLAADTGVTKSDLALWRDHLGGGPRECFVVLNKIDALADPLATPAAVQAQIERQCEQTAATLGVARERVFPLSARDALAARVAGDAVGLARSRLPALEAALAGELLPRRAELLAATAAQTLQALCAEATRQLADRRRQNAEQMLELRGLRGKSAGKRRLMRQRIDDEAAEFERCTGQLAALRAVQARLVRGALAPLAGEALRAEVAAMHEAIGVPALPGPARRAFEALCTKRRAALAQARAQADETHTMLAAGFGRLNAEFGFAFVATPPPALQRAADELAEIETGFGRWFGWTQAWRLATPGFAEQFRRMLLARLRIVFEGAAGEIELWSRAEAAQVDQQLRERRRALEQRRETLARIESAVGELEQRIAEVEAQDARFHALAAQLEAAAGHALEAARERPGEPAQQAAA